MSLSKGKHFLGTIVMTYDFSLDKKQIILLTTASVLLAILLFVAGMLCGMLTRQSSATQTESSQPYSRGTPHADNRDAPHPASPENGNRGITLRPGSLSSLTPSALVGKAKSAVATEKADMMATTRQPIHIGGESPPGQTQRADMGEAGQTDVPDAEPQPQGSEQKAAPENQNADAPASQASPESGSSGITLRPGSLSSLTPSALVGKAKSAVATEKADMMARTRQPIRIGGKSRSGQTQGEAGQTDEASSGGGAAGSDPENPEPSPAQEEGNAKIQENLKMSYMVEVDSFVLETKAFNRADDLIANGWNNACVVKMGNLRDKKEIWYIVQIGDYDHLEEAYQATSEFEEKEESIGKVSPMKPEELKKRKMSGPSGGDEPK